MSPITGYEAYCWQLSHPISLENAEQLFDAAKADEGLTSTELENVALLFFRRAYQFPDDAVSGFNSWKSRRSLKGGA